jgi:hypothetical protein
VYAAWACRFDVALVLLKSVPSDVSPCLIDRVRAEVYLQLGRPDKAGAIVDAYLAKHPNDDGGSLTSVKALLFSKAGEKRDAESMIARAIELGSGFGHCHHTAYNIAGTYAGVHEPEHAIDWLEAAADGGFPCYPCFERDPNLDSLRAHPRFVRFLSAQRTQWERFKQLA